MTYNDVLTQCMTGLGFDAAMLREHDPLVSMNASDFQRLIEGAVDETLYNLDYTEAHSAACDLFGRGGTSVSPGSSNGWAPLALRTALMIDLSRPAREAVAVTLADVLSGERVVVCRAGRDGLHLHDIQSPQTYAYKTSRAA